MAALARHHLVAHLPPADGWRRALHVERGAFTARPVLLAFAPAALADDPARLAALARDAEAAARVRHPHVAQVLGLETVDEAVALAEAWSDGPTLAELLEAGGRLPPDVAARTAADAALGLAALHAADAGDGGGLAHGAPGLERIRIGPDGAAIVTGSGSGAGTGTAARDLAALGAGLHILLVGEPPASPPRVLDAPGIPPELARVVDALVGVRGAPAAPATAVACAEALSDAVPLATRAQVAAYAEAILPADDGERAERARRLAAALAEAGAEPEADAADDLILGEATPLGVRAPAPSSMSRAAPPLPRAAPPAPILPPLPLAAVASLPPDPEPTPRPDAAVTFPAPAAPAPASSLPWVAAGVGAVVGIAIGIALGLALLAPGWMERVGEGSAAAPPAGETSTPARIATTTSVSDASSGPSSEATPTTSSTAAAATGDLEPPPEKPKAAAPPSIAVTAEPPADVYVNGKRAGRAPITVPVPAGTHEIRLRDPARGIDAVRRVSVRGAATPVRFALGRGTLSVNAPDDAEIRVDGRRAGNGSVQLELWEGSHRVEARLGPARTGQSFHLGPGETWTYDVKQTGG
jgi:eukaryotic-like serine/threonine-protein kinase